MNAGGHAPSVGAGGSLGVRPLTLPKALALAWVAAVCAALAWLLWPSAPVAVAPSTPASATAPGAEHATLVTQGRLLATLGNCQHCHTERGQAPYSGGRAIATPFGVVYSSNLTPSAQGLAGWTADDFYRALHHGQSRDGRLLTPAFPFPNTTHITRTDSDALWAYLQSLPPSDRPTPPTALDWPYNTQAALKVWRALYFRPAPEAADAPPPVEEPAAPGTTDPAVQRGAYLAQGLAHCSACHAPRDALGGSRDPLALTGGLMPGQNAYAPSLLDPTEGGVQDWTPDQVVALLRTGRSATPTGLSTVTGPMAEVVLHSTQHWPEADLQALSAYLRQLHRSATPASPTAATAPTTSPATSPTHTSPSSVPAAQATLGARLYQDRCADCHGAQGEGRRLAASGTATPTDWAYPPLAGNRAVTLASPANLVQMVMNGGYAPATAGHPRPFGMPPFVLQLSDAELAAVLTHIRTQWGHQAAPVTELQVQALRGSPSR
jgi:mono/diheme cytochrome c family protein